MTAPLMRREEPRRPWFLIMALLAAATAGVVSLPLQVAVLKQTDAASQADIRRAQELTRQLAEQQQQADLEATAYREDSRRLQLAICDQIESIAERVQIKVPPCPRVATSPGP